MSVPNTNTFNLQDVKTEIEGNGGLSTDSLVQAFISAIPSGFDPLYEGSKDRLLNFRNYNHSSLSLTSITLEGCTNITIPGKSSYALITDIFVNDTESKIYCLDIEGSDKIIELTMSTPGDISTLGYTLNGPNFTGAAGLNNFSALTFSPDGTKLMIIEYANLTTAALTLNYYTLSTAWNLSTMTTTPVTSLTLLNTSGEIDISAGIDFNSDGSKLFIYSRTNLNSLNFIEVDLATNYVLANTDTLVVTPITGVDDFNYSERKFFTSLNNEVILTSKPTSGVLNQYNGSLTAGNFISTLTDSDARTRMSLPNESRLYFYDIGSSDARFCSWNLNIS